LDEIFVVNNVLLSVVDFPFYFILIHLVTRTYRTGGRGRTRRWFG